MDKKINQDVFDEKKLNGKGNKFFSRLFFAIFIIYICLFVVFMGLFLDFRSKFECVPVEGMSMQPTINPNTTKQEETDDWVYIQKNKTIERQDIVVFNAKKQPWDTRQECFIKRVIALEGDAVTIKKTYDEELGKEIYKVHLVKAEALVDGIIEENEVDPLDEEYITSAEHWTYSSAEYTLSQEIDGYKYESIFADTFLISGNYDTIKDETGVTYAIIPEDNFFYLGDNRSISSDARRRGSDNINSIIGVVEILVPDAENSSSALLVQSKAIINYYSDLTAKFFSNLWISLEKAFAI